MKYTVLWNPSADADLASFWVAAEDRAAISAAADRIDGLLRLEPTFVGESRSGSDRIVIVPPLVVAFRVLEEDRIVRILGVRLLRRPGRRS